jgi:hypothetical protein
MNAVDKTTELPEPWYWSEQDLNDQLSSELGEKHLLFRKKVITLARREDNDDVLFQILNSEFEFAVVHLTWSGNIDEEGKWPITKTYKNWNDLFENRIKVDHEDYQ